MTRTGIYKDTSYTEEGYVETFLEKLCAKAGLPRGSRKDAELFFAAEVIK